VADLWSDVQALRERLDKAEARVEKLETEQVQIYGMIKQAGLAGTLLGVGLRNMTETLRQRGVL
jgi:tetrahydromethanopterin S-methyltransferase subunit G